MSIVEETQIETCINSSSPPARLRSRSRSKSKSNERSAVSHHRRASNFDIGPDGRTKRSPFQRVSINNELSVRGPAFEDGKREQTSENNEGSSFKFSSISSHNKENYLYERYPDSKSVFKRSQSFLHSSDKKRAMMMHSLSDEEIKANSPEGKREADQEGAPERHNFFWSNHGNSPKTEEQKFHDRVKMMHYIHMINMINDNNKIKRTVYLPQNSDFNYCGLIIGPKGSNIQRIEEESGCKIYIRGRNTNFGSIIDPFSAGESEPQHVLVIGDCETQVAVATEIIERIIFADEETRNKIRQEQLRIVTQLRGEMVTPTLAKPEDEIYLIPIPAASTGYLIGKNGETIKSLQVDSGARISVSNDPHGLDTHLKNVVIEGAKEAINKAKELIHNLMESFHKIKKEKDILEDNEASKVEITVPTNCLGLLIGKGGENIKRLNHKSGCLVTISKDYKGEHMNEKTVIITGKPDKVEAVKKEIDEIVAQNQKFMAIRVAKAVANSIHGNGEFKKKNFNWREAVPEKIQEIFKEVAVKDTSLQKKQSTRSEENTEIAVSEQTQRDVALNPSNSTAFENTKEASIENAGVQPSESNEQIQSKSNEDSTQLEPLNEEPKKVEVVEENPREALVEENPESIQEILLRTSDALYEQRSIQYMRENVIEERLVVENSE